MGSATIPSAAARSRETPQDLSALWISHLRSQAQLKLVSSSHGLDRRLSSEVSDDDATADTQRSLLGIRKRAAVQDSGSIEVLPQSRPAGAQLSSYPRRSKVRSAYFNPPVGLPSEIVDPEFRRTVVHSRRATLAVPSHKIFDPTNDDPLVRQGQVWADDTRARANIRTRARESDSR